MKTEWWSERVNFDSYRNEVIKRNLLYSVWKAGSLYFSIMSGADSCTQPPWSNHLKEMRWGHDLSTISAEFWGDEQKISVNPARLFIFYLFTAKGFHYQYLLPISVIDLTHSLFTNSKVTKLTLCQINNRFTHAVNTVHSTTTKKKPKVRCDWIKRAADLSTANIPELLLGRLMVDTGS